MPRLDLTHIIIHHTAAEEKDTEQIRRYHMSKGWRDIGYDYVVERSGKTVEGRSLSIQGAHAGALFYNQHAIGVAVIGNLSQRDIYPEQMNSLVGLLAELVLKWRIAKENILLHREIKKTECPGVRFRKNAVLQLLDEKLAAGGAIDPHQYEDINLLIGLLEEERRKNAWLEKENETMKEVINQIKTIVGGI